ncbi:MAG: hypothetical protein IJJ33_02755 [Victivallales bacterium]|nr:hypothetical protein [Victivallales bacterium]
MKNFVALRTAAGFPGREEFAVHAGISLRSVTDYDHDHREPPLCLVLYLRLLANGCQYCPMRQRANIIHPGEHILTQQP